MPLFTSEGSQKRTFFISRSALNFQTKPSPLLPPSNIFCHYKKAVGKTIINRLHYRPANENMVLINYSSSHEFFH